MCHFRDKLLFFELPNATFCYKEIGSIMVAMIYIISVGPKAVIGGVPLQNFLYFLPLSTQVVLTYTKSLVMELSDK